MPTQAWSMAPGFFLYQTDRERFMLTARMLASLELEILAVERTRPGRWWRYKDVSNPYARLYLITDGEAFVRHHGRRFALRPGSLHVIPASTRVDLHCPEVFEVLFAHFTSRLCGGPDLFSVLDCQFETTAGQQERNLFERLLALNPDAGLRDSDPYKSVAQTQAPRAATVQSGSEVARHVESDGLLRQLLAPILRTATERSIARLAKIGRFEDVLGYLDDHLDEPLTLGKLAARAHLHPTYFSDLFRLTLGVRPIDYLNRRRVERAQVLLGTTSLSVKRIAARVGFPSAAHFCRVFKKYCGQTPGDYRAMGGATV
ncbi:MAG: helix-turn-helix transcriptional regulator [Pirellulales bacterium]|nr:helix-turn-helix transcriptional regulator [Pirellulales bacterium]